MILVIRSLVQTASRKTHAPRPHWSTSLTLTTTGQGREERHPPVGGAGNLGRPPVGCTLPPPTDRKSDPRKREKKTPWSRGAVACSTRQRRFSACGCWVTSSVLQLFLQPDPSMATRRPALVPPPCAAMGIDVTISMGVDVAPPHRRPQVAVACCARREGLKEDDDDAGAFPPFLSEQSAAGPDPRQLLARTGAAASSTESTSATAD
uniref:Uncharacterized protein n=1 Tax=Setaria viridis TaxID=4556 RepID=A0A4U6U4M5_SETVI|nr:uncharacterized protein LOC117859534 [Setaria viridis]TKW09094.1 hypothetical protein SEVIR_6G069900v2 [Setaria viridis]